MVIRMEKYIQTMADHWSKLLLCILVVMSSTQVNGSDMINITFLESAVSKGAVCLDGSSPAYYYAKGFGDGVSNWMVYLEGGGWCSSNIGCSGRKESRTGSSKLKPSTVYFGQIFSENQTINPDFYNWNRVFVTYCDGSSFMADVDTVDPNINITCRGARIFDAVMEDLLAKGMESATNAILVGSSAGGLATILHCDGFRALVPSASKVKCISDSGFFLHAKNLNGGEKRANYFAKLAAYHGMIKSFPASCKSKMNPSLCIFPENIVKDIQTPLFLLESGFDQYQLEHHNFSDEPTWRKCTDNIEVCTSTQLQTMKDFHTIFIKTLQEVGNSPSNGLFVHSCFRHGHFYESEGWDKSPILGNKTIAQAIGDWYFDRSSIREIDTQYDFPRTRNCTQLYWK